MSMRSVGPEPKAARLRSYPVPMAIVLIALIAMMLSALGYPFGSHRIFCHSCWAKASHSWATDRLPIVSFMGIHSRFIRRWISA